MKSQDFTNQNNDRAAAIAKLQEFCHQQGLDYTYNTDDFTVRLPQVDALPLANERPSPKKRRRWDISKWGPKTVDESSPDYPEQLPETTTPLEEGEPPKGDDEV